MNQEAQKDIRILLVDDEPQVRSVLIRALTRAGYICHTAANGEEAMGVLEKEKIDVVITDIDMPKMDGIDLTRRIKHHFDTDVIMITGLVVDFAFEDAIAWGASDFIEKPVNIKELIIRLKRVLRERFMKAELNTKVYQLRETLEGLITTMVLTVEARDPYTSGHQERVAALACAIAKRLGLSEKHVTAVKMAGVIHDLGKIAIPAEILTKPNKLNDIEVSLIKTHPQVGYDILKGISFPWPIADIIYQHHERLDGSGYPRGIKKEDILLESRIMAVADVVEARASHRPYRPAHGIDKALKEISKNEGNIYDPEVVQACLQVFNEKLFSFDDPD